MKKLLRIIMSGIFNITVVTSVIGCNQITSGQISLSTLILNKNIGVIEMANDLPNKAELLIGIKAINQTALVLTENDFSLKDLPTDSTETIIGIGTYSGEVTLNYSKNVEKIDLESIIKVKNLQTIELEGDTITKQELLDAIISNNPSANKLIMTDFGFKQNPTSTSVTVVGIGKYRGEVTLTYLLN